MCQMRFFIFRDDDVDKMSLDGK